MMRTGVTTLYKFSQFRSFSCKMFFRIDEITSTRSSRDCIRPWATKEICFVINMLQRMTKHITITPATNAHPKTVYKRYKETPI
jgi:hypothetical protein